MLPLDSLSLNSITTKTPRISHFLVHDDDCYCIKRRTNTFVAHAAEESQQQFEIDPDEARKALQKLDQQLKTLSQKQVSSPKIRAQDVKLTRDQSTNDDILDVSGPFLTYTAISLVIFTVFYNVLFYGVIKPSIDGPDEISEPAPAPAPATTVATESVKASGLQSQALKW